MNYIAVPFAYADDENTQLDRPFASRVEMLDNFIEMLVFTPRGSFAADLDFGFEYWDHEYCNVIVRDFNNGQTSAASASIGSEITRHQCQESIREGLAIYEPDLKQVNVNIELNLSEEKLRRRRMKSKYRVDIIVTGMLDWGLGNMKPYQKTVSFYVEPTAKKIKI